MRMSWRVKPPSLAEHATIELRRITDVLQLDHASLFLRDHAQPQRATLVAAIGADLAAALPEHATIIGRVLSSGRVQEVEPSAHGDAIGAALATPLEHEGETIGALLVVSLRRNRRLGAADTKVIGHVTEMLVERILPVAPPSTAGSPRFARAAPGESLRARR
jgi:GAF domain-containing protein